MSSRLCRRGLHQYDLAIKQCPECKREADHAWRLSNIERKRETNRAWYVANIERAKVRDLAWRTKNGDRNRERARKWLAENPERHRETRRSWAANNPELHRARLKQWKNKNSHYVREARQVRRARLRNARIEPIASSDWRAVVDFYGGRCAYCGKKPWEHQDHVVPLSRGGAHAISNLVPACGTCNMVKHANTWVPLRPHPFTERAA